MNTDQAIESFEVGSLTVSIFQDENAENPRQEWDNLCTMMCFHHHYRLGDQHYYQEADFSSWDELEAQIREDEGPSTILPLYLYDHSGLRIKIGSFMGLLPQGHAEFDSGQVGFIVLSDKKAREELGRKRLIAKDRRQIRQIMESEVKIYDQYVSGQVFGYDIANAEGESFDCCWGFYGFDYCVAEATSQAEWLSKHIDNPALPLGTLSAVVV